jgi:hypothetical protein
MGGPTVALRSSSHAVGAGGVLPHGDDASETTVSVLVDAVDVYGKGLGPPC